MKKFLSKVFLTGLLALMPNAANALAIDVYFSNDAGKKFFEKSVKDNKNEKVKGCGYVLISSLGNKEVVKLSVFSEHMNGGKTPPEKERRFSTFFDVTVGKTNKKGHFEKYKLTSGRIKAPWISREINFTDFPSSNPQLGGYFSQALVKRGFELELVSPELGGKKAVKIDSADIPEDVLMKLINCTNEISTREIKRWMKYYKLPMVCFYNEDDPQCKK